MSRSAPVLSHIPFLPTVTHIHPHPRRPILPASGETVDVLLTLFLDFPCPSPLARRMGNTSAGPLPPSICHAGGRRAPYSVPPCASQLAWMHPHSTVLPLTVACCPLVAQEGEFLFPQINTHIEYYCLKQYYCIVPMYLRLNEFGYLIFDSCLQFLRATMARWFSSSPKESPRNSGLNFLPFSPDLSSVLSLSLIFVLAFLIRHVLLVVRKLPTTCMCFCLTSVTV